MEKITSFFILQCLYFMLPAYFANMAPVNFKKILTSLAIPIDGGKTLFGKPILGPNKTYRGLIVGIVSAVAICFVQSLLYEVEFFRDLSFFPYTIWLGLGIFMGFGAIFGDALKSFFKRRVGIGSGRPFVPFDQIDFVLGSILFSLILVDITLTIFFVCLFLSFFLHIITNHISFWLGVRKEKW